MAVTNANPILFCEADLSTLTKAKAKVELKRLALTIESHNKKYYQDDAPSISDA